MKRKGISPLIAAVLLIAFTMAIASIFAQWAPQLIQSAQGDTTNTSDELQRCSGVSLDIVTGQTNKSTVTVQQTNGENGVGALSATFFYADESPQQKSPSGFNIGQNSPRGFAVTGVSLSELDAGAWSDVELDRVEVSPLNCEGTAPATYEP